MAIARWISNDGDWDAGGSWSTGSEPGTTDIAVLDGTSQKDVISGTGSVSRIWVKPTYRGNIGSPGAPFATALLDTGGKQSFLVHQGSGTFHLATKVVTSDTYIIIDSPNMTDAFRLSSNDGGAVTTRIWVKRGKLTIEGSAERIVGLNIVGQNAHVEAVRNSNGGTRNQIDLTFMTGGTLRSNRDHTLAGSINGLYMSGGATEIYEPGGNMSAFVYGGWFRWNVATASNSAASIVGFPGAIIDFNDDGQDKTVTVLEVHDGTELRTGDHVTVTTLRDFRGNLPDFGN